MKCLSWLFAIFYFLLFVYVISITFWSRNKLKILEKNPEGKFGGGLEQDIEVREKRTRNLLLGFTPGEALKYVTDAAIATAAIMSLLYSSLN